MAFATQNNPAPSYAENGEPGEYKKIKIELKLLADVGLVGLPSVGKSTFISKVSASKPKIASYPFTTLKPNLGVVKVKQGKSFVLADLPGLIKGASLGQGLGDKFLKHIERTKILVHIIDMADLESENPYHNYLTINNELQNFNPKLLDKPQIIVANKMDMPNAIDNLNKFKTKVKLPIYPISAIKGEGLMKVINAISDELDKINSTLYQKQSFESHVIYKFNDTKPFSIIKENNEWLIKGKEIEKFVQMTKFNTDESVLRFSHKLKKIGIDDELRKLGAQDGDTIRILDLEFEFKE